MRTPDDPAPARRIRPRRPTMRENIDRELRPVLRTAMLGTNPLPSRRWKEMHSGRTRPAGTLADLARDARLHGRRSADEIRAALHRCADTIADALDHEFKRAA